LAIPNFSAGQHRFVCLRPASASSTSSPPPSATRVGAAIRARGSCWDGARFPYVVPIRLKVGRGPRFNLWFSGFWFG